MNVGAYCTKGGGQCSAYGNSLLQCSSDLSPIGGNFVYVREVDGGPKVVCCGKARSLASVLMGRVWPADENAKPDDVLYIRLNASGRTRDAEHDDLVAGLPRQFVIYEME